MGPEVAAGLAVGTEQPAPDCRYRFCDIGRAPPDVRRERSLRKRGHVDPNGLDRRPNRGVREIRARPRVGRDPGSPVSEQRLGVAQHIQRRLRDRERNPGCTPLQPRRRRAIGSEQPFDDRSVAVRKRQQAGSTAAESCPSLRKRRLVGGTLDFLYVGRSRWGILPATLGSHRMDAYHLAERCADRPGDRGRRSPGGCDPFGSDMIEKLTDRRVVVRHIPNSASGCKILRQNVGPADT